MRERELLVQQRRRKTSAGAASTDTGSVWDLPHTLITVQPILNENMLKKGKVTGRKNGGGVEGFVAVL